MHTLTPFFNHPNVCKSASMPVLSVVCDSTTSSNSLDLIKDGLISQTLHGTGIMNHLPISWVNVGECSIIFHFSSATFFSFFFMASHSSPSVWPSRVSNNDAQIDLNPLPHVAQPRPARPLPRRPVPVGWAAVVMWSHSFLEHLQMVVFPERSPVWWNAKVF